MKAVLLMLQKALSAGPKSLGELRRKFDLDPSIVLRLVHNYPDKFSQAEVVEDRRMHPAVEAVTELSAKECAFVKAVRGAGERGASETSLHRSLKLSARQLAALADKFDLVWTERRNRKVWFFWRPSQAPQSASLGVPAVQLPESDQSAYTGQPGAAVEPLGAVESAQNGPVTDLAELSVIRERLTKFLGDGSRRELGWICQYIGLSEQQILETVRQWPDAFELEEVNWSRVPSGAHISIRLRRAAEPESRPVEATPSLQPALSELVDPEELAIMKFKPGSPGMAYRRNSPTVTRGGYARTRRPLVDV